MLEHSQLMVVQRLTTPVTTSAATSCKKGESAGQIDQEFRFLSGLHGQHNLGSLAEGLSTRCPQPKIAHLCPYLPSSRLLYTQMPEAGAAAPSSASLLGKGQTPGSVLGFSTKAVCPRTPKAGCGFWALGTTLDTIALARFIGQRCCMLICVLVILFMTCTCTLRSYVVLHL